MSNSDAVKIRLNDVHVWSFNHDEVCDAFPSLIAMVSTNERAHALNYSSENLQRHWIVRRGMLRVILSKYLGVLPEHLNVLSNSYGRPYVEQGEGIYRFNQTHTANVTQISIATGGTIGIDSEVLNQNIDVFGISQQFFTKVEAEEILSQPPGLQHLAFYSCWTRKESFIKALGYGLSIDLSKFKVSVSPYEQAKVEWIEWAPDDIALWHLMDISRPGFATSLATDFLIKNVICFSKPRYSPTIHTLFMWEQMFLKD